MGIYTNLLLGVGLSMDAVAVAVTNGSTARRVRAAHAIKLAFLFGLFQALMPVIGWSVGLRFQDLIASFDHWIAFILLGLLGAKMIYSDLKKQPDGDAQAAHGTTAGPGALLVLAIATSIDALAVGFSLTFMHSVVVPVATIGLVTFTLCLAGVYLGHRYRNLSCNRMQIVGGLILIAVGLKILIEHLFF